MSLATNFRKIIKSLDKRLEKPGNASRKASDGSVCCVEFKNIDWTEMEDDIKNSLHLQSSMSTITIGSGSNLVDIVIEYCIQSMIVCEESTFCVDSELLKFKFTATLQSCLYKPYSFQMPDTEKLSLAYNFKQQGVQLFEDKKLEESFLKFRRSLQYIMSLNIHYPKVEENNTMVDDITLEDVFNLMLNLYNNMALIHLNLKHFDLAISLSTFSIDIKPNIKALYRRACAFAEKCEFEKAESDLNIALTLDNSNKAVIDKLTLIREKDKNSREKYKETIKNMFA